MTHTVGLFDSHVHLDAAVFAEGLEESLAEAQRAGVCGALNPGVDLESSRGAARIHRRWPWVLPAAGLHPLYLGHARSGPELTELENLASEPACAAIGEVGLDFWKGRDDEQLQRDALEAQARLAQRLGRPLLLHVRKAFYETFAVLRRAGFEGTGVVHAFSGSRDMARLALDRGFYLSACATLMRPQATGLRSLFRWLPRDRILVETDAPDLPPWNRSGETHRPCDLPAVVRALAQVLGESFEAVAELTTANARRLLRLPERGPA